MGLTLADQININKLSDREAVLYNYFVANGWAAKRLLMGTKAGFWNFQTDEIKKEIYFLRKAISCVGFNSIELIRKCQIYTNLGNALNSIGRFTEAQQIWQAALEFIPESSITLANKAVGLIKYGGYLYDNVHRSIFKFYAYIYTKKAIEYFDSNVVEKTRNDITELCVQLEKDIPEKFWRKETGTDIFIAGYKNEKGWQKNPGMMKDLGYVLPKA